MDFLWNQKNDRLRKDAQMVRGRDLPDEEAAFVGQGAWFRETVQKMRRRRDGEKEVEEMKIKLRVQRVGSMSISKYGTPELLMDAEMTEGQFLDAILSALESVPGETWEKWKQIIDGGDGK